MRLTNLQTAEARAGSRRRANARSRSSAPSDRRRELEDALSRAASRCGSSWPRAVRDCDDRSMSRSRRSNRSFRDAGTKLDQCSQATWRNWRSKREFQAVEANRINKRKPSAQGTRRAAAHRRCAAAERRLGRRAARVGACRQAASPHWMASSTRIRERIAVLSELEDRLEGLGRRRAGSASRMAREEPGETVRRGARRGGRSVSRRRRFGAAGGSGARRAGAIHRAGVGQASCSSGWTGQPLARCRACRLPGARQPATC